MDIRDVVEGTVGGVTFIVDKTAVQLAHSLAGSLQVGTEACLVAQ